MLSTTPGGATSGSCGCLTIFPRRPERSAPPACPSLWPPGWSLGAEMRAALQPGQVIDGFVLEERIGAGGMARLWAVSREGASFPMVMKLPILGDSDDPVPLVGFEVEQMILPRLQGPHVPRFVASAGLEREPYIVMERIPGASLVARLDRVPLPVEEVARIGARVATALHDLHLQHVIHLDVKPSNVMFRDTGEA